MRERYICVQCDPSDPCVLCFDSGTLKPENCPFSEFKPVWKKESD